MRLPLLAFAVVVVLGWGAGFAHGADHPVVATNFSFSEPDLTITQGDTVTWTNSAGEHNVAFDDGLFTVPATPALPAGWPPLVRRTFDQLGSYRYVCVAHAPGMSGRVTVVAPSGQPPPPPPGGPTDPGTPAPPPDGDEPPELAPFVIRLTTADRTPLAGKRFVLSGTVAPARDGRRLQIQRRLPSGRWKTIAIVRLKDAGSARSKFSLRLKLSADAVLRARLAGDDRRATGLSKGIRIDVHR